MNIFGTTEEYEVARAVVNSEFEDFDADPKGYIESLGISIDEYPRINELKGQLAFSKEDVEKMEDVILQEQEDGKLDEDASMEDIFYNNRVHDFTVNLVCKYIKKEYGRLK